MSDPTRVQDTTIGPPDTGFTTVTLKTLLDERAAYEARLSAEMNRRYDERLAAEERFYAERDRRYAEVAQEREKALKIKEQADRDALTLAREIQIYKDEKANELREQINSERGLYATKGDLAAAMEKFDAQIGPLSRYVNTTAGRSGGLQAGWGYLVGAVGLASAIIAITLALLK